MQTYLLSCRYAVNLTGCRLPWNLRQLGSRHLACRAWPHVSIIGLLFSPPAGARPFHARRLCEQPLTGVLSFCLNGSNTCSLALVLSRVPSHSIKLQLPVTHPTPKFSTILPTS